MFRIRLRELREANNYKSQQSFADAFGVAQSTVAGWESGKREPNFDTIIKLANFFDVSVDYLLGLTNYRGPSSISPSDWDSHHIREIRQQTGETQEETAQCIGIPVGDYRKYENAEIDPPIHVLLALAVHFCCSIDFLLDFTWGTYDSAGQVITGNFILKNNDEQRLVEYFRRISPEGRERVWEQVEYALQKYPLIPSREARTG